MLSSYVALIAKRSKGVSTGTGAGEVVTGKGLKAGGGKGEKGDPPHARHVYMNPYILTVSPTLKFFSLGEKADPPVVMTIDVPLFDPRWSDRVVDTSLTRITLLIHPTPRFAYSYRCRSCGWRSSRN